MPLFVLAVDPTTEPLIQGASDLVYQGAFRVPEGDWGGPAGSGGFSFGGTALTYNAANNSIYLMGSTNHQLAAEINIPPLVNSTVITNLNTATVLQNFTDPVEGQISAVEPGDINGYDIGGMLVYGGKLYLSDYPFYDADGLATTSHFVRPMNLSITGQVQGPFKVGTLKPGYVSGYMNTIPPEWQSLLGGTSLTGNCCLSIVSRTSYGPALATFNPSDVGTVNPVPANQVLYYPGNGYLGVNDEVGPYWDSTAQIHGVVFPDGTRSVLFIGRMGDTYCYGGGVTSNPPTPPVSDHGSGANASTDATGQVITLPFFDTSSTYGEQIWLQSQTTPNLDGSHPGVANVLSFANPGAANASVTVDAPFPANLNNQSYTVGLFNCYDPEFDYKGVHGYPYRYKVWAYDANDFAAVKAGQKNAYDVKPYAMWNFDLPIDANKGNGIGGAAYDRANQLLYISQLDADSVDPGFVGPVIHAFKITAGGSTLQGGNGPLPAPTLNLPAYMPVNGSVTAGYSASYSNIRFQWTTTPTTGGATPSASSPKISSLVSAAPSANFQTASNTAALASYNLSPGQYVITVQAMDASGNTSPTASATVTLVQSDFSGLRVFPNPWRSDKDTGLPITFDHLPLGSAVKVFTVSGHWVTDVPLTTDPTVAKWLLTNDSGDKVASGIYLYLIKDSAGDKTTGKFVVIK